MNIENLIIELEREGFSQVGKDDPNVITMMYEIEGNVVNKAFQRTSETLEEDIRQFQKDRKIRKAKIREENANKDFIRK